MSLNISLSGIQAINGQLNQISNNIANSATVGFKSGRANFAFSYMQGAPQGVYIGSTSQSIDIGGNLASTGRGMDAAIQGHGFFVSKASDGSTLYSRNGQFDVDKTGILVDMFGRHIQGYDANGNGNLGDISVLRDPIGAEASSSADFVGNMSADWKKPDVPFDMDIPASYNGMQVTRVYDSLGREHSVTQYFVRGEGNTVNVYYAMDGKKLASTNQMTFNTDGAMTAPTGKVTVPLGTPDGATAMSIDINYIGSTMYAGQMATTTNSANGHQSGQVTGFALDEDGSIQVQYSNGVKKSAGKIAIANFPNELALAPMDGSAWLESSGSGAPIYAVAGSGLAGKLQVSALEQSNVDMTAELVNLMTSQQSYQANSKALTTQNDMVKNLIQAL